MAMTGNEIRKSFIEYFESKGHKHVRSSSLVPHNDPTILFTNAGMNQFKDYFLGNQTPEYSRAVTSQKVMRAGGKHNDLENVGRTDRHHTFFEMLGNFSFGDYFKKEAIEYGWEYLTVVLGIPEDKLAVSVFEDDQEAFDLWNRNIGIPAERIGRLGEKDNFWSMGDVGPCGPCSEIHYQLYPLQGGKNVQKTLEDDDGTFLEIWNLVFMQFNQEADGTRVPLPNPSIDTGMGIERIASVIQGVTSNFETDLLNGLVSHIKKNAGSKKSTADEIEVSARVIADHIRASVFLIADGVIPSNEGRGYVLRRIIRRAARHGKELGYEPGFFAELVDTFVPMMEEAYPEISENQEYIKILLHQEERRFSATLNQGIRILDDILKQQKESESSVVDGESIFKLYDTYGFPVDLADDILQDHYLTYDVKAFEKCMEDQRQRAKAAQDAKKVDLKVGESYLALLEEGLQNSFVGYRTLDLDTKMNAVLKDGKKTDAVKKGDKIEILLSETPFYAESGGQVGDTGEIIHDEFRIVVTDTYSPVAGLNISAGDVVFTTADSVKVTSGTPVRAVVNESRRKATEANHTATHLLQSALRTVLGDHVKQSGSLVNSDKLRFDFSHYAPVTREQLNDVEILVNDWVRENREIAAAEMDFDQALESGAMAIFGEKYGDVVRVVSAGDKSQELCGGCHTSETGNIGTFKIVSEESIAAGIRRIEALTGRAAIHFIQGNMDVMDDVSKQLRVPFNEIGNRVNQLSLQLREREKAIEQLQKELQQVNANKLLAGKKTVGNIDILAMKADADTDIKSQAGIILRKMNSGAVLLSKIPESGKISVVLAVSKDLTGRLNAGEFIKENASLIDARGGGSANMAQCGGTKPEGWDELKAAFEEKAAAV